MGKSHKLTRIGESERAIDIAKGRSTFAIETERLDVSSLSEHQMRNAGMLRIALVPIDMPDSPVLVVNMVMQIEKSETDEGACYIRKVFNPLLASST